MLIRIHGEYLRNKCRCEWVRERERERDESNKQFATRIGNL